ncbi:MAG: hypothetical protein HQM00_02095 [Magnetococcales bacterium]|jgi:hypothetical protein|nr:hypothetical protein [Magnetococcales bacterium]
MSSPEFATLQARLQAHHGQRLDAAQWNRLVAMVALEPFLARARETALGAWLVGVDPGGDVHHLEEMMRGAFLRHVAMVASWTPQAWQPAVRWLERLPDLTAALHVRRHGADHAWLRSLEGVASCELPAPDRDPLDWWLDRWQALWPRADRNAPSLIALTRLARTLPERDRSAESDPLGWSAWLALRESLELRFRRDALGPGALFVHLWLMALDLHRLRGELCRRRLFVLEERA